MSDKGFSSITLIIIFCCLIFSIVLIIYLRNNSINEKSENNITQPTQTTTPNLEDPGSWNTYTDSRRGFLIKYPDDWGILERNYNKNGSVDFVQKQYVKDGEPFPYPRIGIWIRGVPGDSLEKISFECQPNSCKTEYTTLNNAIGLKVLEGFGKTDNYFLTDKQSKGYPVRIAIAFTDVKEYEVMKLILQTFRYIE